MRTTLTIDDELIVTAKKLAAEEGRSVSAVVCDALRRFFDSPTSEPKRKEFVLPTFKGTGDQIVDSKPSDFYALIEAEELSQYQP